MSNKKKILCDKCQREITSNNFDRHYDACIGPVQKKIRGIDFDPNLGYKDGSRQAWNKGIKIGPNISLKEHYDEIRKAKDTTDFKTQGSIRRKVLEEQNYRCNRCGIDEWLGQPISFELEHKDGVRTNNERINLEALCPNCHSLTPTWRGRNRRTTSTQLVKGLS
jgi:Zn finger protein HypA/HybF involved in hydrogenase expression